MTITREDMIKIIAGKSGFFQRDVRLVLKCMDEAILESFGDVDDNEEVMVQVAQGIKVGCSIIPERRRKDPRNQADIVCAPTCKPKSVFSQDFRALIQKQYDAKKGK